MTAILARIFLSLTLLLQGVSAVAAVTGAAAHAPCHASTGHGGKPAKMPCCHCDECTLPACAAGCSIHVSSFAAAIIVATPAIPPRSQSLTAIAPGILPPHSSPPLRPPIA